MRHGSLDTRAELEDAGTLLLVMLVILASWVLLLGWAPHLMLVSHDALTLWTPYVHMLASHALEPTRSGYEWTVLGGTKLREILGVTWLLDLGAWLQWAPATVINLVLLHTQVGMAFFAVRAGQALAGVRPSRRLDVLLVVLVTWLAAFSPMVAWRVEAGHLNLLMGTAAVMGTFYVAVASLAGTLSMVGILLAWLAMFTALQTHSHQLLIPAAVFLGPLAVALVVPGGTHAHGPAAKRTVLLTCLLLGSAVLFSADITAELVAYGTSDDAARRPGAESVAHGYHVATAAEWFGSLWWSLDFAAPRLGGAHQHETNAPLGPVVWLAVLGAFAQGRRVGAAFLFAVLGVVAFSAQVEPFSTVMLRVMPLLGSFRLPARTMLPVFLVALVFVVPALAAVMTRWTLKTALLGCAPLLVFLAPGPVREVAAWCAGALLLPWAKMVPMQARAAAAVMLAMASVGAFAERHTIFPDVNAAAESLDALRQSLEAEVPPLKNPLHRVHLRQFHPLLSVNSGIGSGLSTMVASSPGGRRFTTLYNALLGLPDDPTFTLFMLQENTPAFEVMAALYNIGTLQQPNADGSFAAVPHATPGPAWFPLQVEQVDSIPALATRLLEAHASVVDVLKGTLFLAKDDAKSVLPESVKPCPGAVVSGSRFLAPVLELDLANVDAVCPLVVATNHVMTMQATAVGPDGSLQALETFVADGSLLGVVVPAGTQRIQLVSPQHALPGARVLEGVALLLLVAVLVMGRRRTDGGAPLNAEETVPPGRA